MKKLTALQKANQYIEKNSSLVGKQYRNEYHAMPPIGWMNDPNGFIYAFGKYHLFFQFHPYSAVWGPMHWGHFSSDDLIIWKNEPVALAPDTIYDEQGCFSGSAIVKDGKLYLLYTAVSKGKQTQALAVSDDGIHFNKLGQVITTEQLPPDNSLTDFRDPKVFEKNGIYYTIVGSISNNGKGRILLFKSKDLLQWEYVGVVLQDERTNVCECPDYFQENGKEVIIESPQNIATDGYRYQNQHSNLYLIGNMNCDSGNFKKDFEGELDNGFDFYAAQTTTAKDGRRIMIAWMYMWDRTNVTAPLGWSGCMTLPRELTVMDDKVLQSPVREIENYRKDHYRIEDKSLSDVLKLPDLGFTQELSVTFDIGRASKVGLKLFCNGNTETLVYYDKQQKVVVFDRSQMEVKIENLGTNENNAVVRYGNVSIEDNLLTMRLFIDTSSCEVFFNNGECVMSANIYTKSSERTNYLFAYGGTAKVIRLDAYSLDTNKQVYFGGKNEKK